MPGACWRHTATAGSLVGMPKKYLIAVVGAVVVGLSTGIAALLVQRSRREPPPVSATVPRVEQLSAADPETQSS